MKNPRSKAVLDAGFHKDIQREPEDPFSADLQEAEILGLQVIAFLQ